MADMYSEVFFIPEGSSNSHRVSGLMPAAHSPPVIIDISSSESDEEELDNESLPVMADHRKKKIGLTETDVNEFTFYDGYVETLLDVGILTELFPLFAEACVVFAKEHEFETANDFIAVAAYTSP